MEAEADVSVADPAEILVFGEPSCWHYRGYPWKLVDQGVLKTGDWVTIRPATPLDIREVQEYLLGLSKFDRYKRYLSTMSVGYLQSDRWLKDRYDGSLDYRDHMVFLVTTVGELGDEIIGVCHAYRVPGSDLEYEVSYSRLSQRAGQGIGTLLMKAVLAWGQYIGARSFTAQTLKDNEEMKGLFRKFGFSLSRDSDDPSLLKCIFRFK